VCGAPIYESFGPAERKPVTRDPVAALRRSLMFPGLGFHAAGDATMAFSVGFMAVAMAALAILEFAIDRPGFGAVLAIMIVGLWVIAARDSRVLAETSRRDDMWLRPRFLTLIGVVVSLIVVFTLVDAFRIARDQS
jgi:hypothetical protein